MYTFTFIYNEWKKFLIFTNYYYIILIMIKCNICDREFKSIITNSHLKTHNMTTGEYKIKFGNDSLSSDGYRERMARKYSGTNNPNYGKTPSDETKAKISKTKTGKPGRPMSDYNKLKLKEGLIRRESRYESGELTRPRTGVTLTREIKGKISKSIRDYAEENPGELRDRALRAVETKRKTYDEWPCNPKGSMKYISPELHYKLSTAAKKANAAKVEASNKLRREYISKAGLKLLNEVNSKSLDLECLSCNTMFNLTPQYFTKSKFKMEACPKCYPRDIIRSKAEDEIYKFVKSRYPSAISNTREVIPPLEIDIFVPELNIGFEFSGLYWHSEAINESVGRVKDFDNYKQSVARDAGINLYIIFEDEWKYNSPIVMSRINNILNYTDGVTKLYARKCEVREITSKEANIFLNENHLQGSGRSNVRYGLYYNGTLVSVMTFSDNNISRRITGWEVNRFCSALNHTIVGGASRLFKRFIADHDPREVISYADTRWSEGDLYKSLGFKFEHQSPPNYWYFKPNDLIRKHRYSLRKNSDDDVHLTEYQNRLKQGYLRIWDCGSSKWIWSTSDH